MTTEVFKVQVIFPHFLQIFLQRKATCSNFDTFKKNLIQRYGFLQWSPLKVEWYDADGDRIRIYNEDDWGIYMEMNGTKVNVQIDNRWIYSAKTSFTNDYPYVPTPIPISNYELVQKSPLRRIGRKSTSGNEPRKQLEKKDASKNVAEEKSSGSNQTPKYDEVQPKEHESGLSKQPKTVEIQSPVANNINFDQSTVAIQSQKHSSIPTPMRLPTPTAPIPIPTPISSQYIHFGINCNSCLGEIRGYRYKCNECPNYDLCSKCEMQKLHNEHLMIVLDDPNADTDYDPRFWKATLNKYESKNVNEEEDNQEKDSSINETYDGMAPRKRWVPKAVTKNVNEEQNKSGSNQTDKFDEVQSKAQESNLPKEQTTVENQSGKSSPVLQPIEQTTKSIGGFIGICEPSTVNDSEQYDNSEKPEHDSVVTTDYTCPPAVTSDSSRVVSGESTVAKITDSDVIGNDVRSDPFRYADPFLNKFFNKPSTMNVKKNKSNLNITKIKKPESNTFKPTMFAGKSADAKTAYWDQGCGKSNNIKSKFASEYGFWRVPPAIHIHHRNARINESVLQMISMGYTNSGGWLSQLMEKTNGDVVAALDLLEVND